MKPGNQIILLRTDDPKSGPTKEWAQQFASNLKLVSGRYNAAVSEVKIISPKDKDAGQMLKVCSTVIVILHESWMDDGAYTKLIDKEIMGGGEVDKQVVLVNTSPGRRDALNGKLEKLPSFIFFDSQSQDSGLIDETASSYWSKLLDIVLDLGRSEPSNSGIIYLAQTEADINPSRDIIRRELVEHGYRIVPDIDLASQQKDIKSLIQKDFDQSRLAIHILGNNYGAPHGDTSASISELQVRYIGEYLDAIEKDETLSASSAVSRLIWVDPEFNPVDKQQSDFVDELKRNIEKLHRTEIIQNPLELFKTLIIKKLHGEDDVSTQEDENIKGGRMEVYIIHQKSDEKGAGKLRQNISDKGIDVTMLDLSGVHEGLLRDHKKNLRSCDATIIYYDKRNRPWLKAKVMDLLKAPGYGRATPLKLKQLLTTGEDKLDDFVFPAEIKIEKETEQEKALSTLLKQLKQ
jgi:hypothetical protein